MISAAILAMASAGTHAAVSYYACDMQVTFRKPYVHGTDWVHSENRYNKYLKVDDGAKMVYLFNDRNGGYAPICSPTNRACESNWQQHAIKIDGTKAPDNPQPPYLDFRRSLQLDETGGPSHLVIADFGDNARSAPYMSWNYDGPCKLADKAPQRRAPMGAGPPAPRNPNYEVSQQPAMAVSDAERDRVLADYYGNSMTGYSGGGHWFHMWFWNNGLAYAGDDYDMTSEGSPALIYIGKDTTGYRMCRQPIPAEGERNCYPVLVKQVGEGWTEHDMDGDALFMLLRGRQ
jgi:hypothetical protein